MYILNHSNGIDTIKIEDNSSNNVTNLVFVGKGTTPYGQYLQTNILKLLENFAGGNAPTPGAPITGQLWYDTSTKVLKVYNSEGGWKSVAGGDSGSSSWLLDASGEVYTNSSVKFGKETTPVNVNIFGKLEVNSPDNIPSIFHSGLKIDGTLESDENDDFNNIDHNDPNHNKYFTTKKYVNKYALKGTNDNEVFKIDANIQKITNDAKYQIVCNSIRLQPQKATVGADGKIDLSVDLADKDKLSDLYYAELVTKPTDSAYEIVLPTANLSTSGLNVKIFLYVNSTTTKELPIKIYNGSVSTANASSVLVKSGALLTPLQPNVIMINCVCMQLTNTSHRWLVSTETYSAQV